MSLRLDSHEPGRKCTLLPQYHIFAKHTKHNFLPYLSFNILFVTVDLGFDYSHIGLIRTSVVIVIPACCYESPGLSAC